MILNISQGIAIESQWLNKQSNATVIPEREIIIQVKFIYIMHLKMHIVLKQLQKHDNS